MPYLSPVFGGDKGPATVTAHALHHWALRHMGEPPVVSWLCCVASARVRGRV